MRILLAASASYVPPRGGATRGNLAWIDELAASRHECRILCGTLPDSTDRDAQLREEGISDLESRGGLETAWRGTVRVVGVEDPARRVRLLRDQIAEFAPDRVLISSEDVGHRLLIEAHELARDRLVYLAHTPQFFPFGPESWNPDPQAALALDSAAAVVVLGRHMAEYTRRHLGRDAVQVHPPIYGRGPWPELASFDAGLVTMINPSAAKGIDIFAAAARRMPDVAFGAVPGWATTREDLRRLARLANVEILPGRRRIDDLLSGTRVLLMPSLWYEGFGLIVVEAMLRGIPVVSSDSGGLTEAKLGTRFVIHTPRVPRYEPVFDDRGMPRAVVPDLDTRPWVDALRTLLSDRALYESESADSRERAQAFVTGLEPAALEKALVSLPAPRGTAPAARGILRVLLAQNQSYFPAHGGGDKSNRLLVEALAARGHICRVVARTAQFGEEPEKRYRLELDRRGVRDVAAAEGSVCFNLNGVDVAVVTNTPPRPFFEKELERFRPDVILASTDDPAQMLLEAALRAPRARVVYLVRATLALPFGPDCAFPSPARTEQIRRADLVVGVSEYVASYVRRHAGIEAVHVPISLMDDGPWPELGRFENEFVTLVNPCAVKGISIFLALAGSMPDVQFAAVPTWGTNEQDRKELARRPNVRLLPPADDIDRVLERTRVLLVPSLWAEARSRMVVEAMLRGVPVIASDTGGLREAKMGVPYLLPVHPIVRYRPALDEQMVPVAEVPPQDAAPWRDALAGLLGDRELWSRIAWESRQAALGYAGALSAEPFESLLRAACAKPKRAAAGGTTGPGVISAEKLTPEKRRLLAILLRKRATAADWFPRAQKAAGTRLFCFPHAGGGAAAFERWESLLPPGISVCPVRLPGRENRVAEAPFERMDALVEALETMFQPYLSEPFAFYGHSMGAAVAFELARRLRRGKRPAPRALVVAGARAPQFRANWTPPPDPSDEEFQAQLRRLEGMPAGILDDPTMLRLLMPALRADTGLYRNYVYTAEPALDIPLRAYGGAADLNVREEHVEAWSIQTTASFAARIFEGGHFFPQTAADFFGVLAKDLEEIC